MPATTDPHDHSDNRPAKSRLETEIDEILERAEREHPSPPPPPIDLDAARRQRARPDIDMAATLRSAGTQARQWLRAVPILVAFAFAVLANTFDDISPLLARLMVSAAVVAFFWPILECIRDRQASPSGSARMWRGRDMGPPPAPPQRSPFEGIRQWLRDRRILP